MKKIIFIMPLLAFSLLTSCVQTKEETYAVTFDANGGKVLGDNPVIVTKGRYIKAPTLDNRPGYNKDNVVWKDKDGNPFKFYATSITEDTVLYADWGEITTYHVSFCFKDRIYATEDVTFNDRVHRIKNPSDNFDNWYTDDTYSTEFNFDEALTGEKRDIYIYGREKPKFTITVKDENEHISEQTTSFSYKDRQPISVSFSIEKGYTLTNQIVVTPTDAATVEIVDTQTVEITPIVDKNIVVTLKTEAIPEPYYYNIETSGEKMKYYANEERSVELRYRKARVGEDFVFYMVAEQDPTNSEGYLPPTSLDITINDVPLIKGYVIEPVTGEFENIERKVTIPREYINGNIKISGNAIRTYYYQITCPYLYGIKQPEIQDTYFKHTEEATFEFIADDDAEFTTELLTAENIYVNLTGEDDGWISPAEEAFSNYGKFEHTADDRYILTIYAEKVPQTNNIVKIIARTQDYPTLEKLSWDQISRVSENKFASSLFSVGDTKTVYVSSYNNKVRILDFNRDVLKDEETKTAGITFEFVDVIKDISCPWDVSGRSNHDFSNNTTLKNYCENNVYSKMPSYLKSVIKTVKKKIDFKDSGGWTTKDYNANMFPLSYDEVGFAVTEDTYQYYERLGRRGKNKDYWLRSPDKSTDNMAYYVGTNGALYAEWVYNSMGPHPIAPCFCV